MDISLFYLSFADKLFCDFLFLLKSMSRSVRMKTWISNFFTKHKITEIDIKGSVVLTNAKLNFIKEILIHISHKNKISIQEIYDKVVKHNKAIVYKEDRCKY